MKNFFVLFASLLLAGSTNAQQTTAMDFQRNDCYGNPHHLFSTLDSNNVVILEYAMDCSSCINAAHKIETMKENLDAMYPGKIRFYQFAYTNSYTCNTMIDFVQDNNINAVPFDSGAAQVAYYGGFGMPTVVIVAGASHEVLFTTIGFSTSDTTQMSAEIQDFFSTLSVGELPASVTSFTSYPNPAVDEVTSQLTLAEYATIDLQLFDITGKKVADIYHGTTVGLLSNTIDLTGFTPGMYVLRAVVDGHTAFNKISVTR